MVIAKIAFDRPQGDVDDQAADRRHSRAEDRRNERQPLTRRHCADNLRSWR
jgi:hypothetical protein